MENLGQVNLRRRRSAQIHLTQPRLTFLDLELLGGVPVKKTPCICILHSSTHNDPQCHLVSFTAMHNLGSSVFGIPISLTFSFVHISYFVFFSFCIYECILAEPMDGYIYLWNWFIFTLQTLKLIYSLSQLLQMFPLSPKESQSWQSQHCVQ